MDLADQIDDYICSFEGVGDLSMDTLAMLIFAWVVIALFLVWLCKFLYKKYVKKQDVIQVSGGIDLKTGNASASASNIDTNDKIRNKSEPPKDILSKEILAKTQNRNVFKSGPKSGGGSVVPSTPTLRKRLSRKSPGPELRKPKTAVAPPSNVVGPDTVSVTWTSQVFRWLYMDLVIVNELLQSWIHSVNEFSKKSVEEHGVAVEIIRILPESPPPAITNIFCNSNEIKPSDLTITCDCDSTPVLQIKALRQKAGKVEISHYKATVSRFRGHLSTKINYLTLKGDLKVEGYPDIRVGLNSIGPIKGDNQDESQLQELVIEILINALRGTVYPIDFSVYSTCPRAMQMDPSENITNLDHFNNFNDSMAGQNGISTGRRLLVKVVKGDGLVRAADPYCVVEMDEPPQKNQTGARQGINPYWDEHFLFDLTSNSAEILFEIYDRPSMVGDPPRFLGLGLVGIDELSVGPSSSQILTLQPRPYETEKVSGAITVEFVFIEGAEIPAGRRPYKLKEALKINTSPTGTLTNGQHQHGKDIADAAIKAIERGALSSSGNASKSTLIIHSVQRNDTPLIKPGEPMARSSPRPTYINGHSATLPRAGPLTPSSDTDAHLEDLERGRTRTKKRDFFGTLKRRLGRSKTRTKSMDRDMMQIDAQNPSNNLRSASADRGAMSNNTSAGPRLNVPTLDQSRRSSISETSGISGLSSVSNKTFTHEASTLVLETIENGVKRHFLVPMAIAQRPRWRRKGTKLHIYNDHTFIAKHLSGGLSCDICNRSIPRRPGKQGYECRDCLIKCHKQCHVRAPQSCINPTVLSIELSTLPVLSDNQNM